MCAVTELYSRSQAGLKTHRSLLLTQGSLDVLGEFGVAEQAVKQIVAHKVCCVGASMTCMWNVTFVTHVLCHEANAVSHSLRTYAGHARCFDRTVNAWLKRQLEADAPLERPCSPSKTPNKPTGAVNPATFLNCRADTCFRLAVIRMCIGSRFRL